MKEREICLIDLIVEILLRWRVIVVWMLIGGILMGAFGYVNSIRTEQAQQAQKVTLEQQVQEQKEQLEALLRGDSLEAEEEPATTEFLLQILSGAQLNNINLALNYEEYAADRQAYIENSIVMRIDAQAVPSAKVTFVVETSGDEEPLEILRIYEDMVSASLLEYLAEKGNSKYTSANYSEVIGHSRSSDALESGSNSFGLNIIHENEELCRELTASIIGYFEERCKELQEQLGAHSLEVVDSSFTYVMDNTLMTNQRNYRNEVTSYIASAENLKTGFSEYALEYYNRLKSDGGNDEEQTLSATQITERLEEIEAQKVALQESEKALEKYIITPAAVSVKYIILGVILFAFIYVFYVFVMYIFNTKLRATDDVKEIYGVAQLGAIPAVESKKKILAFVDGWIRKLRNYNKRMFTEEEAIGLAAVAVKMAAKKEDLNAVYCVGCDIQEKSGAIAGQIRESLGRENISFTLLNNVLYNQEAMAQLADAKAVVLLEKVGETLYEEIANELELLQRQEIKVLGAIIVE